MTLLDDLRRLVEHETPSRDGSALDAFAVALANRFRLLGASDVQTIPNPDAAAGGHAVRARFPGRDESLPPTLILGHFDTVWPIGTLAARMPWRVENGRAHGPGVYDMKAAIVQFTAAWRMLQESGQSPARPAVVLFTPDEEIGSPGSRPLIEAEAGQAARVLVLEPPLTGGVLKTARKGIGAFTLTITGRAAHAGVEPEKGCSAVVELAHQILAISALNDPATGTTVNVGVISGGTVPNVIPGSATARIDVRAWTTAEAARVESALRSLQPVTPGTTLAIEGGFNRPPMERTPAIASLFEQAQALARESLGLNLSEGSTGGGSDANFTAALGVPTLDGLGTDGAGAHAEHEHILVDSLPDRAALLALLLSSLDDG
jgi:glutamate carboxypeptidase